MLQLSAHQAKKQPHRVATFSLRRSSNLRSLDSVIQRETCLLGRKGDRKAEDEEERDPPQVQRGDIKSLSGFFLLFVNYFATFIFFKGRLKGNLNLKCRLVYLREGKQ